MADAETRLAAVRERIAEAARRAGRDAADIRLIAISKTFDAAAIEPVLAAGQRIFGENRVQEAQGKWPQSAPALSRPQPASCRAAADQQGARRGGAFRRASIRSTATSSPRALAKEMARQGRALSLFVQVNTGEEPQKAGVAPQEAAEFVERCRDEHKLAIEGLMCIPPAEGDPAPHFEMLAQAGGRARPAARFPWG